VHKFACSENSSLMLHLHFHPKVVCECACVCIYVWVGGCFWCFLLGWPLIYHRKVNQSLTFINFIRAWIACPVLSMHIFFEMSLPARQLYNFVHTRRSSYLNKYVHIMKYDYVTIWVKLFWFICYCCCRCVYFGLPI